MKKKSQLAIKIGWLYPDLMNTYGDRGNMLTLSKRASWRGIKITLEQIFVDTNERRLADCDLLFMGGAQDTQQEIVNRDLGAKKGKVLMEKIEKGTPGLYICGAYQFLGKYYKTADGKKLTGLGVFPLYTENPGEKVQRLIGNVRAVGELSGINQEIIGFENHGGRTYLGKEAKSFASIKSGFGNNGEDGSEGIVHKNSIGTYFHGPLLPKNPKVADWLIEKALEVKYKEKFHLEKLDDSLEEKARNQTLLLRFK